MSSEKNVSGGFLSLEKSFLPWIIIGNVDIFAILELAFPTKLITSISFCFACSIISIKLLVSPERDMASIKTSSFCSLVRS